MKITKIDIPIYFGTLIVIVTDGGMQEVKEKFSIKEDVSKYSAFVWAKNEDGFPEYYISIDKNVSNHLIAHEVVHLVNYLFIDKGIKLDRKNDEAQAYLTGWFFQQIENVLIT